MTRGRQLVANRQNARLSTGPRTPAGKAVGRWNALRHGLRAETVVLPDEVAEDYLAFRHALVDELQPAGEMEALLVERIVSTAWRLRRVARVEAGLFVRNHYDLLAEQARKKAGSYQRGEVEELLDQLNPRTITDEEAHARALQEATEAEALRDSDANAMAGGFARDKADTFSKLARYETSLERSLYKALHELQRLQATRAGRAVLPPVAVDVTVDTSQQSRGTNSAGIP